MPNADFATGDIATDIAPIATGETLWRVPHGDGSLRLFLRHFPAHANNEARRAVLYLNGARLPSAVTVSLRLGGRSWRDDLAARGWDVWALDYLGYGHSDRFPEMEAPPFANPPLCRAEAASEQVATAIAFILSYSNLPRLSLLAHSWGANIGAMAAIRHPSLVERIVMFGPITHRSPGITGPRPMPDVPAWNIMTAEEWIKVLRADVPEGAHQPILAPHLDAWTEAFLGCDPKAMDRSPPGVQMPWGAMTDVAELWNGGQLFDPSEVTIPAMIVRGEWDSYCADTDAAWLMRSLRNAPIKQDVKIGSGTHFMFYEESRFELYRQTASFLEGR
jgi:pimeloyl-ACP methyl ester carboxylesterase